MDNVSILERANAAILKGDYESFLTYCSEDTVWRLVGYGILWGKVDVRNFLLENFKDPPKFDVWKFIPEGDYVTIIGKIQNKTKDGKSFKSSYCNVWKIQDGKLAELTALYVRN